MSENEDQKTEHERLIEREARANMGLSTEQQALFLAGGGGLLKGGSPVTPYERACHEIRGFLDRHLRDSILEKAIYDWIAFYRKRIEQHPDRPIRGLLGIFEHALQHEGVLAELVRNVDILYGQIMQEKPHFQRPGEPPSADDAYTLESVRQVLQTLAAACRRELQA